MTLALLLPQAGPLLSHRQALLNQPFRYHLAAAAAAGLLKQQLSWLVYPTKQPLSHDENFRADFTCFNNSILQLDDRKPYSMAQRETTYFIRFRAAMNIVKFKEKKFEIIPMNRIAYAHLH